MPLLSAYRTGGNCTRWCFGSSWFPWVYFFAAYLAQVEFGGWFAPSLTFLLGGLGALILVFIEFKWLSKSPLGKRLFMDRAIEGGSNKEVATLKYWEKLENAYRPAS